MICPRCAFDNVPGVDVCSNCLLDLAPLDQPVGHDRVETCLLSERVAALKPRRPATVGETQSLGDALKAMVNEKTGAVLVIASDGGLRGILSERDLLMRAVDYSLNGIGDRPVSEFMTHDPETVTADDSLAKALNKMDVGQYRHLPVVADGKPVGIIAVQDLVRHITRLCKE